jgi:thiol-disulfide isomerase/thioredoxin
VTYVVAALVVTNALTLLNLLLLFGVIRRLREQSVPPLGGQPADDGLPVGTRVEAFETTDIDGHAVRLDELPAGAIVGFFSPGCGPCETLLPKFVAHSEALPGGRGSALAVVVGAPDDAADYVVRLSRVARVVVEDSPGAAVGHAFRVSGYPTVFQLDGDGTVLFSGASLERLPVPAE